MQDLWMIFLSIFVLAFGVFCVLLGTFTAYFGTGRSRNIGGALILFGLVAIIIVLWFTGSLGMASPVTWEKDVLVESIVAIVAALIGAGLSLLIFLGAIMKS